MKFHSSLFAAVAAIAASAGCSAPAPAQAPTFDPVAFFKGPSRGDGQLRILLKKPRRVQVQSVGTEQADGSLLLEQRVQEEGKPVRLREWRLRRSGPASFTGTLTDAAGPVRVEITGQRARIRYRMKEGLDAEQWLTPRADGRTLDNRMRVRKAGIIVARFDEIIIRR